MLITIDIKSQDEYSDREQQSPRNRVCSRLPKFVGTVPLPVLFLLPRSCNTATVIYWSLAIGHVVLADFRPYYTEQIKYNTIESIYDTVGPIITDDLVLFLGDTGLDKSMWKTCLP